MTTVNHHTDRRIAATAGQSRDSLLGVKQYLTEQAKR
jgi:hypothetical protein